MTLLQPRLHQIACRPTGIRPPPLHGSGNMLLNAVVIIFPLLGLLGRLGLSSSARLRTTFFPCMHVTLVAQTADVCLPPCSMHGVGSLSLYTVPSGTIKVCFLVRRCTMSTSDGMTGSLEVLVWIILMTTGYFALGTSS